MVRIGWRRTENSGYVQGAVCKLLKLTSDLFPNRQPTHTFYSLFCMLLCQVLAVGDSVHTNNWMSTRGRSELLTMERYIRRRPGRDVTRIVDCAVQYGVTSHIVVLQLYADRTMHVCMYVCTYVRIYVCMYVRISVCECACMCARTCLYVMCVCVCVHL